MTVRDRKLEAMFPAPAKKKRKKKAAPPGLVRVGDWLADPVTGQLVRFEPAKKSKFGNVPTWVDGIRFASKKEAAYYGTLKLRKQGKEVRHFEIQPRFQLTNSLEYVADFRVTLADGTVQIVDVKGVKTAVYRMKKRLMKELLGLEIVEV